MAIAMSTRLLVDTSVQIFNPFLTIIAAGMGVDVITAGRLVSLRSVMGLASPLFGALADRIGYRLVMRLGLLMGAVGLFLVGISRGVGIAALGMALSGIGLSTFVPTLQAYLSSRLPYTRLAQGLAVIEYAWALAGIIGLFLTGLLIAATSWRVPFFVLAGGLAMGAAVFSLLPPDVVTTPHPRRAIGGGRVGWAEVRSFFDMGPSARSVWGAILANSLIAFSVAHVIIIHGAWLNREYGLGPAELGTVALVGGLADLCASVLVSLVTDKLGKRRSVLIGASGAFVAYALLPFLNRGVWLAVTGISLARFFFEVAIVSNIPLLSEQAPDRRGKVLTVASACGLIGITIASLSGPWAYMRFGVWGLGSVSAAASALTVAVLVASVREGGEIR
jgi:predicted MFS family arabinose efflux permease